MFLPRSAIASFTGKNVDARPISMQFFYSFDEMVFKYPFNGYFCSKVSLCLDIQRGDKHRHASKILCHAFESRTPFIYHLATSIPISHSYAPA